MNEIRIPKGKFQRTVITAKTAGKVSGQVLTYLVKKPFLSKDNNIAAKKDLSEKNAETIFKSLTFLKGTALKIAQFLSMELEILPEALRKELEKSYNRVPPLNRAMVRKILKDVYEDNPESVFKCFEAKAFAAASLGQVHRAKTKEGHKIALKIQYPGIKNTIESDLKIVRTVVKPLPDYAFILPGLDEVEEKLMEETDYINEGKNLLFFKHHLKLKLIKVPALYEKYSSDVVIAMEYIKGLPLNEWIKTNPSIEEKNKIAESLFEIFIRSLYELKCIHADPNPGNFIITPDLKVGLIDFGCIKQFDPTFVDNYQKLNRTILRDKSEYFSLHNELNLFINDISEEVKNNIMHIMHKISIWYGRFYKKEWFDFKKNKDIFTEPQNLFKELSKYKKYFNSQPDFIYLDRTRYGLYRIFEKMEVKIKIRNTYEWDE
ncbi:MAG: AarF/ABC1/UbiB kinase family protein [Desulfobacteraceae bacterium]|nr:AarF/ABC1/UbiB kinase family protein [Desulfobacteraceae bacterium]